MAKHRKTYSHSELQYLNTMLHPVVYDLMLEFNSRFTVEDILEGSAYAQGELLYDLLETEAENSIESSQVAGRPVKAAFGRCHKHLHTVYNELMSDKIFATR